MSLSLRNISYRRSRDFTLSNVSIECQAPVTALIGPNGAGKSTLIRCVAGQLRHEGSLSFGGVAVRPDDQEFFNRAVGFLPQDSRSESRLTVFEVVLLGLIGDLGIRVSAAQAQAVENTLALLGLDALSHRRLAELSGGQQQMVLLAQVLCKKPKVLLLDEPLNNLDIHNQFVFLDTVIQLARRAGMIVVIVLHDIGLAARYADRIAVLRDGQLVVQGTPDEVISEHMLGNVFKVDSRVISMDRGYPAIEFLGAAAATV